MTACFYETILTPAFTGVPQGICCNNETSATEDHIQISGAGLLDLIHGVSEKNLRGHVQKLVDFKTRYATTENAERAAVYLFRELEKMGYEVRYQYFLGKEAKIIANIIAAKPGCGPEEGKYLVTAHYDSISDQNPKTCAPGADDNASGVSALMEVARVLSAQSLGATIEFVLFSGEEGGQLGSDFYVWEAGQNNERINGFINLDMIGFGKNDKKFAVLYNELSEDSADRIKNLINKHLPRSSPDFIKNEYAWKSDHTSFWKENYRGLNITERVQKKNPYMETANDTPDKLNFGLISRITKAALLLLVDWAGITKNTKCAPLPKSSAPKMGKPNLQYFKNILRQRTGKQKDLFKLMQLGAVIKDLKDQELMAGFVQKADKIARQALLGADFMQKAMALVYIAKAKRKNFLEFIVDKYPEQNTEIKPFFLMALSDIGDEALNPFLLKVYRKGENERIKIQALKTYAIINRINGLKVLRELRSREDDPDIARSIDSFVHAIENHHHLVQTW